MLPVHEPAVPIGVAVAAGVREGSPGGFAEQAAARIRADREAAPLSIQLMNAGRKDTDQPSKTGKLIQRHARRTGNAD
jgi:hypothetical protein